MNTEFDAIARDIIALADRSVIQRIAVLRQRCPWIPGQIRSDAVRTGPLPFWGRCVNIDELTATTIVSPAIVEALQSVAGRSESTSTPHAGLQHTYGYLFSLIPTPFGRKRDRWVSNIFEVAFGQPPGTFGPNPKQGTLLSHATWLAGHFAFRREDRLRRLQKCLTDRIHPSLHAATLVSMPSLRLEESIVIATRNGRGAKITLRTDLVQMPRSDHRIEANPWLLVYSIADSRRRDPQLITLFAVSDDCCAAIESRAAKHRRSDIRPRYNAFIPGLASEPHSGQCRLVRQR
jgi:hypothetical protein